MPTFKRDIFSGELVEQDFNDPPEGYVWVDTGANKRLVSLNPPNAPQRSGSVWGRPWKSRNALALENPNQIGQFNQALKDAGVSGAYYQMEKVAGRDTAVLNCESRSARNGAMKLMNCFDKDGGYRDYTGS